MLRRYRSLKKVVYAASILFGTIVLYAGTSSHDYEQEFSREWILPIIAREKYHVDASLQEPLHRLPLGPFEDHPVPIVVEALQMQIPTFEDDHSEVEYNEDAENMLHGEVPKESAPDSDNPQPPAAVAAKPAPDNAAAAPEIPHVPAPMPAPPAIPAQPAPAVPAAALSGHIIDPTPSGPVKNPPSINSNLTLNANIAVPKPPQSLLPAPAAAHNPPPAVHPPTKSLPDLNKTTIEMAHRLNHTRLQCDKFKVPNKIDSEIYQLPQYNLSYCKIPKAGCTYWEQVISYLNQPSYQLSYLGVKMPFQISKFDIRYTSHFNLPRRDFEKEEDRAEIMKSKRLLFVRHPLERLWSCYLEKFYLIDFWTTAGISMKTTGADVKCPKSITFREFIDFTLPLFNENWAPMTELCNPCVFQPDIIGHVETLHDDSYYTLKQINLEWIFTEHDKFSREENQMLDMTIYNYQLHSIHWYSFYHKCLSQKELAAKLWDVFKKVGYLSSHAALPDNLPDYNQTTIINELKLQFRRFPLGPVNGRAQQLKMMKRDFESLPKPTMAKILERYAMDFQLFGYNTQLPLA